MPFKFIRKLFGWKGHKTINESKDAPPEKEEVIQKKPRSYDQVDLPPKEQQGAPTTESPPDSPLNYVEVDIKPSGASPKIVNSKNEFKTQYSTIDIEATKKHKEKTELENKELENQE